MAFSIQTQIHPGSIVRIDRFPYEEDSRTGKCRRALVAAVQGRNVRLLGIYSNPRHGRRPIRSTYENGLPHVSYLDPRHVDLPAGRVIEILGEEPLDNPSDEFAA